MDNVGKTNTDRINLRSIRGMYDEQEKPSVFPLHVIFCRNEYKILTDRMDYLQTLVNVDKKVALIGRVDGNVLVINRAANDREVILDIDIPPETFRLALIEIMTMLGRENMNVVLHNERKYRPKSQGSVNKKDLEASPAPVIPD